MEIKYEVQELLLHKETKFLIQVDLHLISGKPAIIVYQTNDGINIGNQVLDAPYLVSLPEFTGNLLVDLKAVLKHFRKHGFKTATTITQTSKGIKFS